MLLCWCVFLFVCLSRRLSWMKLESKAIAGVQIPHSPPVFGLNYFFFPVKPVLYCTTQMAKNWYSSPIIHPGITPSPSHIVQGLLNDDECFSTSFLSFSHGDLNFVSQWLTYAVQSSHELGRVGNHLNLEEKNNTVISPASQHWAKPCQGQDVTSSFTVFAPLCHQQFNTEPLSWALRLLGLIYHWLSGLSRLSPVLGQFHPAMHIHSS